MKKKALFIFLFMIVSNAVFAADIPVRIKPEYRVTTSNLDLKEGDSLDFVISEDVFVNSKKYLNKGQKVTADVTSLEDNGFLVQPAKLYVENFRTKDAQNNLVKLKGIIYKSGNSHSALTEFFVFDVLRGGEVQIKPEKDEFIIYIEEKL